VVVCYRDEGSIKEMLKRLGEAMKKITPNWEVIYVNDNSPDNAEAVLLEEAKNNNRLTVISHSRNFGAQVAFTTGMTQAKGEAVVIMDGDLQDPPELIEEFARKWLEGNQVVYGIRAKRKESLVRNIGYKVFYKIFKKIAYIDIPLDAGEFSLMDRIVVDVILACKERDLLVRGLRAHAGFKQTGIPFERPARYAGTSNRSLLAYFMWAYRSFVSFSLFPLRLITVTAFVLAFLVFLILIFHLAAYFLGVQTPKGYMTLLTLILGLGAINMMALGVIGEYIGRLFVEIKDRPQPVIKTLVNDHRNIPRDWMGIPPQNKKDKQ
ncbi:MAG: glycosyltransferase family 2 protein, partial [Candidatus Omnitrophica bacterium]|nr:glycosyltransferase family 2 protein [Candidatus Omnitrophota bacterium]